MRHIIPISGKDSLATAIIQTARHPRDDYEFVFNPTGLELPEVFEWIDMVSAYFGKPVVQVSEPLADIIKDHNYFLPSQQARYCTRRSKIEPFEKWIGKDECMVYYGIRADEERGGYNNSTKPNIIPVYPLKEAGIGIEGVYILVNKFGLKPPAFFWPRLHESVSSVLGYNPKGMMKEWQFDMLFAGRSRANCDRCFNQRLYEWVWLLETHPDRFWEAESWEHLGGGEKQYTWATTSLKDIDARKDEIFFKRRDAIVKSIIKGRQMSLFQDDEEKFMDILSVTSCGLFCGK